MGFERLTGVALSVEWLGGVHEVDPRGGCIGRGR